MNASTTTKHSEQRGAVVLAILFVLVILMQFPQRIRLFPPLFLCAIVAVEIIPLIAIMLLPQQRIWQRIERVATLLFSIAAAVLCIANLATIITVMLNKGDEVSGLQLLISGLGVWIINILSFSILYWSLDRGGPGGRDLNEDVKPDWLFPQEGAPSQDCPENWKPAYVDYLFLGYCTAAAFSPTDVLPLTHRAKLLMMLQSSLSLLTILVVLSRAINILA